MKIKKDGDMWCVTTDSFLNLQESDALFISSDEMQNFLKEFSKLTSHEWGGKEYNPPYVKKSYDICSRCGIKKEDSIYCEFPLIK